MVFHAGVLGCFQNGRPINLTGAEHDVIGRISASREQAGFDTYLEIFQGLGLLLGGMLIACVVVLIWDCVKGARTRQRDATVPAIAASVSVLVGINAFADFSLQIQAVTLTYMAILGAGVAQARDDLPSEHSNADTPILATLGD